MAVVPLTKLRNITNINLGVLTLRLIQFFFCGMEVGLMAYYIKQELDSGDKASSPYCFMLVIGVGTMIVHFVYCFEFHRDFLLFLDMAIGTFWVIGFFWLLNYMSPLPCGWSAFNPFGSNHCGQSRAVLVIAILVGVLWYVSSALSFLSLMKKRRGGKVMEAVEV